jgi:hypothetical protein
MDEPTRSDFYVYVLFRHDTGAPFYVGKGRNRRVLQHKYRHDAPHKIAIIKRAAKCGAEIPAVKIAEGLTENEAFAAERLFITAIGRETDGGPLINLTSGGEGHAGYSPSAQTRAKIAAHLIGRKQHWAEKRIAASATSQRGMKRGPQRQEWIAARTSASGRTQRGKAKAKRGPNPLLAERNRTRQWTDEMRAKVGARFHLKEG